MNAYELAVELSGFMTEDEYTDLDKTIFKTCNMLRHQADYIKHLEEGLESSLNLNKAQATRGMKELTDEEIIETVKDHFIGAIKLGVVLTNDNVLGFARAILKKASEK